MNTEVSTDLIIEDSLKYKEVYVPKCYNNGLMKAVRIRSVSDLCKGSYGIMEPVNDSVTGNEFDLVIIPCVTAGRNGERLGHGAGYYDRFLKDSKGEKICLCCSENIRDDIEMDDNDIFMDMVISEEETYIYEKA
jgi:5-formyltetrahydrofolate cyclo-ligase